MKKNRANKGRRTRHHGAPRNQASVIELSSRRVTSLHQLEPMGAFWRQYPPSDARKAVVERLRTKPEAERSADDWWQLGEYQILDGLSSGDEALVNTGSQALMSGASMAPPHAGCLLDLGWLLCYKGLDQMALVYLNEAVHLVPASRDAWTLRGWACIGAGARDQAIASFRQAVSLPEATDDDRATLKSLEAGEALDKLRKNLVLKKFDDEIIKGKHGDLKDGARNGVVQFRQLLERMPDDLNLAYGLAYCHYILGQFDHAEPLLLRVIGGQPDNADALTLLGLIAMKRGNEDRQLEYYQRAAKADPHHVLANTNLASMYQEQGDYHRARPLLVRAIEAASEDDPNLAIALDLLGISLGAIEHDYAQEAELHRRAIALDSHRGAFHANLIFSLLSADRAKDAQRELQAAKDARLNLPDQSLLEHLVKLYQDRTLHPSQYMQFVTELASHLDWPALKPLVRRAWDRRQLVPAEDKAAFLNSLGLMASRTGDEDLALDVWRLGMTLPDGQAFGANFAAELSMMGRHSEALAAADVMSMDTPRSWTMLGNIRMNAGLFKLALEAYRVALERDERFLLPLANAVATARLGFLADELDPFIERLKADWQSMPAAIAILGQALALQGRLSSAAERLEGALWKGEELRTPEDLWEDDKNEEDLSLLGIPSLEHHYAAARCLFELGRFDRVLALITKVRDWPQWMNGDWMVLESEVYLARGDLERAAAVVDTMPDQPPPRLVAAKIAIARGNLQEADRLIRIGLADEQAKDFSHPHGRPDALFRVLASRRALSKGIAEEAEALARDAVRRDPSSAEARMALVSSLAGQASEVERQQVLLDGLRRSPGHPSLVSALVESLVNTGDLEEAAHALESNRSLLMERGAQLAAHRLGEFLAVDRLSRMTTQDPELASSVSAWGWVNSLPSPLREWLRGAWLALERSEELAAAYGLYVSKVAEYLLMERVMVPFRDSCPDAQSLISDRHRDVGRFITGGAPPSLGGIARLFASASRSYRSSEEELTTRFRDAISRGRFGDPRTLRSEEFVNQLTDLGRARNSAAHLGSNTLAELQAAARCVIDGKRPGLLLRVLKIV